MGTGIRDIGYVALSYLGNQFDIMGMAEKNEVGNIINEFLDQIISFPVACARFARITGTVLPIEKLNAIIQTPNDPIPFMVEETPRLYRKKSRPWTAYEDQRLLAAINKYGKDSWTPISAFVGNGRSSSQCSQRWVRGLNPKISKASWTKNEEDLLVSLVNKYGDKSWTRIASEIGNRSDVQCRYRYQQLTKDNALKSNDKDSTQLSDAIDCESDSAIHGSEDNGFQDNSSTVESLLNPKNEAETNSISKGIVEDKSIPFPLCMFPQIDPSIFSEQ